MCTDCVWKPHMYPNIMGNLGFPIALLPKRNKHINGAEIFQICVTLTQSILHEHVHLIAGSMKCVASIMCTVPTCNITYCVQV